MWFLGLRIRFGTAPTSHEVERLYKSTHTFFHWPSCGLGSASCIAMRLYICMRHAAPWFQGALALGLLHHLPKGGRTRCRTFGFGLFNLGKVTVSRAAWRLCGCGMQFARVCARVRCLWASLLVSILDVSSCVPEAPWTFFRSFAVVWLWFHWLSLWFGFPSTLAFAAPRNHFRTLMMM